MKEILLKRGEYMDETLQIAYAEVMQVLKLFDRSLVMKIPIELLEYFKEHQKKDFIANIDKDDIFNKNNISKDALALLAYIDLKYWANEDEKKVQIDVYRRNTVKVEDEKKQLFNEDVFANKKTNEVKISYKQDLFENRSKNDERIELPVKYKESIWKKLLDKIKIFFVKIRNGK